MKANWGVFGLVMTWNGRYSVNLPQADLMPLDMLEHLVELHDVQAKRKLGTS